VSCGGRCRCGCGDSGLPCGCCEGIEVRTPRPVASRSGLSTLAYRVGTHPDFLSAMLARLSSPEFPALRKLRTRSRDDWTIALLDAWAVVADVLTFYEERIANEGYLGTATEGRSVRELARLIGYELRPGGSGQRPSRLHPRRRPPDGRTSGHPGQERSRSGRAAPDLRDERTPASPSGAEPDRAAPASPAARQREERPRVAGGHGAEAGGRRRAPVPRLAGAGALPAPDRRGG